MKKLLQIVYNVFIDLNTKVKTWLYLSEVKMEKMKHILRKKTVLKNSYGPIDEEIELDAKYKNMSMVQVGLVLIV